MVAAEQEVPGEHREKAGKNHVDEIRVRDVGV